MSALADVAAVVCGLAIGGLSGYAAGRSVVASRRRFWLAAGLGIVACVALDIVGVSLDSSWIMVGSLGVMAGWLTGLKYGGIAEIRVWEPPAVVADAEPGDEAAPDADAPTREDAGAVTESCSVTN